MMVSTERLLGSELVRAAEELLAGMRQDPDDPTLQARQATVQVLLALYWELRHLRQEPTSAVDLAAELSWSDQDFSLAWLSSLLCSDLRAVQGATAA